MKNLTIAVLMSAALVTGSSYAAEGHHAPMCEAVFGASTNQGQTGAGFDFGGGSWSAGVVAAYHHLFADPIQFGGVLTTGVANSGATGASTTWSAGFLLGPTFNFMNSTAGDISDAMFLMVGAGLNRNAASSNTFFFQFGAELGKRFKVWDNVSYRPSFSFTKSSTAGATVAFHVNLLNLSILY